MPITYRSDSDSDFKCLERHLESGAFGELPDAWIHQAQQDLDSLNELLRTLAARTPWLTEEVRKQLPFATDLELPTKFDSPLNFQLIDSLVTAIKSAAVRIGLDVTNFPHYSNIPTGMVNACAVDLTCSSKPFLLFDSQLLLFCHLFSKAFARCLPVSQDGDRVKLSTELDAVRERVKAFPDVVERLADVLVAYVTTGTPGKATPYHLEGSYVTMAQLIRDGMERFVVAHEFGHVYAGHLRDLLAGTRFNMANLCDGNESHRQEHEADLLGLLLTLHAMNEDGYDAGTAYLGIDLFFVALDMADRFDQLVHGGVNANFESASSVTHPSNQSRRDVLREAIEHLVEPASEVAAARSITSQYDEIVKLLWGEIAANPAMHADLARKAARGR